jgi:hypothetical protein
MATIHPHLACAWGINCCIYKGTCVELNAAASMAHGPRLRVMSSMPRRHIKLPFQTRSTLSALSWSLSPLVTRKQTAETATAQSILGNWGTQPLTPGSQISHSVSVAAFPSAPILRQKILVARPDPKSCFCSLQAPPSNTPSRQPKSTLKCYLKVSPTYTCGKGELLPKPRFSPKPDKMGEGLSSPRLVIFVQVQLRT